MQNHVKIPFDQVQQAFINGDISLKDFTDILIDNFGFDQAFKIIKENLSLALKNEND